MHPHNPTRRRRIASSPEYYLMKLTFQLRAAIALIVVCLLCSSLVAQTQTKPEPQKQMGGVSTGAPVTYTSKRTAGIVDANAPIVFEDVTDKTALANFHHRSGSTSKDYIFDTPSGGVAIFDYDGDGRQDVYLLNGSTLGALQGKEKPSHAALFRNLGNWKFEDVTEKAGVANDRWGFGVAVGDYNNDGRADLFVGNFGVSRLYKNNGDGTFTDVAEKLGVARNGWSTGASWGDYDGDGRLDLFVPGYVQIDFNKLPPTPSAAGSSSSGCQFRGEPVMCGPRGLTGDSDTLYHQKADGNFEDVSLKAGVNDPQKYYGFASAFVNVNDDNLLDLIVVNDSTPKQLYINKGNGTFEEVGYPSGVALNENGREQAGMGLAVGDYDNDGRIDFHITNFSDDSNVLYHNDGDANFTDVTFQAGVGEVSIPFLGWGTSFFDYDNDGWQDLFVVNGHVYPLVDDRQWGTTYAQQALLFHNLNGKFQRIGAPPRSALAQAWSSRGLAIGDLDNDGRLDAVINNLDSKPTVLRNVAPATKAWIELRLVGDPAKKTPRDAIGSVAFVTTGKVRQRGDVISGAGFCSQNEMTLHFGLGSALKIDKLEITWSNGSRETFDVPSINRIFVVTQGKRTLD
jgi:hypothetical protein